MRLRPSRWLVLACVCGSAAAAPDTAAPALWSWSVPGALLLLLLLSGIFSGSEIALVSLSMPRIRAMVASGMRGARQIERLKARPNRMLITILLGNNLTNIGASVLAAAWTSASFGSAALGVATAVLTLLILVFGEIFPKSLAQQHAEGVALWMARPLLVLQTVLLPVVVALEWMLRWSMGGRAPPRSRLDAEAELQATVELLSAEGRLEQNIRHLMSGTFAFGKKRVGQIMTPRPKIVAIDADAALGALRDLFVQSGISRIPVYEHALDRIVGIVNMRALLKAEEEGKRRVAEVERVPALQVRPSMYIDDLMLTLQAEKQQLAVVSDAGGRVLGVATLENALEEIVGEIFDEEDRYRQFVRVRGPQQWEVTGDCPIHEFRNHFRRFAPDEAPFKSMATLFAERSGARRPQLGDRIEDEDFAMQVSQLRNHQIARLKVERRRPGQ